MIFIATRESLFSPEGEAIQAVYPLGRFAGVAATGGIYAAPTEYTFYSLYYTVAGGAYPAPTAE